VSDTKGFWRSVTVTGQAVTGEKESLKVTPDVTPHLEAYKSLINFARSQYLRVPTKSGKPSKGPRWMCVMRCTNEGELGVTMSNQTKGKRWACKTCLALCEPVWSDGPLPDLEDIEQEWAEYMAKGNREVRSF